MRTQAPSVCTAACLTSDLCDIMADTVSVPAVGIKMCVDTDISCSFSNNSLERICHCFFFHLLLADEHGALEYIDLFFKYIKYILLYLWVPWGI